VSAIWPPWAAIAFEIPHAIERLLATPIMRPRLPAIRLPVGTDGLASIAVM